MSGLTIALIIVGILILWLIMIFNALIRLRNRAQEGWSDIDVQLKRRHDLIPNLITSVKGYMKHEQQLLENITRARSAALDAQKLGNTADLAKAEQTLGGLMGSLRIAVEAYPELKANQNMAQLMDELSDTENKIQAARRFYNGMVRDFNTKIESFPDTVVANLLHFKKFDFFELQDANERENVKVSF